ncbi:MAG: pyridoxal phosphate-dependent aminotransferase [Actinomycetota bacterium]
MPLLNTHLEQVDDSALARIDSAVAGSRPDDVIRLHQGKTWFPPCWSPRPWGRDEFELLAHEHAPPAGVRSVRTALADRIRQRYGRAVDPDDVVIVNGATHGIAAGLRCVLEPGAEVLVPSPQWLFATGLVVAAGGVPVEVPVFLELDTDPRFDFVAALEAHVTPRTRALYFNTPNNPTGFALDESRLAELAGFAQRHDLWIFADNAYEDYDFSRGGFRDIGSLGAAAGRTFSVFTFSKSYAMPGHRVGYVVAPEGLGGRLVNSVLYSAYSVATTSQFAALRALGTSRQEMLARGRLVEGAWHSVHASLEPPHTRAEGGLYTFLDLAGWPAGPDDFLGCCLAAGVTLAPGRSFGRHCSGWARLCFAAVRPEVLHEGIARVNQVWARGGT